MIKQRRAVKATNWFGDGALTPQQNALFAKNKALDGKKNPEFIINRIPMQTITGFKRSIKPSFLSNTQSRPLGNLHNPFPHPKLGNETGGVTNVAPKVGARKTKNGGRRVGSRLHRIRKGGIVDSTPMSELGSISVGQRMPSIGRIPYVNTRKMTLKIRH